MNLKDKCVLYQLRGQKHVFALITKIMVGFLFVTVFQYTVEDATEYRVFIRSQRGAPLLTLGNFIYRCERVRKTRSYWLCIRYKSSKCNGRVICQGNKIIKLTEHCHANDQKRIRSSTLEETDLSSINLEDWSKQTLGQKRRIVVRK